ncbi:damage repair protein [Mycoplasmatota bacterium WC44]
MSAKRINRKYLCIDLKSFYASVECLERGLDVFTTKLVVADRSRGNGSVCLAVTPPIKEMGVNSRCRVYELPKDPEIIFAKPQMKKYLEVSSQVLNVYLNYVSFNDIYVYSIDEAFLDVTSYLEYYKMTDIELAKTILKSIQEDVGIYATCGIGPNMVMSKFALDIESKHKPDFIAKWEYNDLKNKLWSITNLTSVWGIGAKTAARLNKLGIQSMYDLAHSEPETLHKEFGYVGLELFAHAWGVDESDLRKSGDSTKQVNKMKSAGQGQTLFRDYDKEGIKVVIREMLDNVCRRLRYSKKIGKTVNLAIGYSKKTPGGFSRQKTIDYTQNEDTVYEVCMTILDEFYEDKPIRKVHVSVGNLIDEKNVQYSLFDDIEKIESNKELMTTMDNIKQRFGKNKIHRAISYTEHGTSVDRNKLIGGHNAIVEEE